MTEAEALEVLRRLIPALQKERSNAWEACGGDDLGKTLAATLSPWSWGEHALLPKVVEVVERGSIDASGFRNILWVVKHHLMAAEYILAQDDHPLPDLDDIPGFWEEAA